MIGVVGATPAGLAAAYRLVRRGHDVRVFAADDGSDASTAAPVPAATDILTSGDASADPVPFSFVRPRDEAALELCSELGLEDGLEWTTIRTAMYVDGAVHPVDTPWEFLAYPPLSLADTARLASIRSGVDVSAVPRHRPRFDAYDPAAYTGVTAEAFVREHASDAVYESFYEPLLEARFGPYASSVSASWVLTHCRGERERSRFGRERRGFLAGSAAVLVEALLDAIGRERVATGARVESLEYADGAVDALAVERAGGRERIDVDAVILATSPDRREALTGSRAPVPIRTRTCLRVSTTAEAPLTESSRVTMVDDAPFGELVTHTALRSPDRNGGHRCYLLDGGEAVDEGRSSAEVERKWLEALAERFAAFDRNDLASVETTRVQQPVPVAGVSSAPASAFAADECDDPLIDGVYDVGCTRRVGFPERTLGGALEAGLTCGARVAETVGRVSRERPIGR